MTLLHSLWQAGLQSLLYTSIAKTFLQKTSAAAKRNLLLLLVGLQIIVSIVTFIFYYLQPQAQLENTLQYYSDLGMSLKPYLYNVSPWLISLYFVWLLGKTVNLIMAWRQFVARYKTGLQKPPIDLKLFTKITANHMGVKKQVQLWLSENIHTPITFGHFKPIILLPVALVNQISVQQAEALVIHELTHIKVKDYLLNWLLTIAETLYFFNPFIGYLCRQAKLEREKYCDTNVLYFGKQPVAYAEALLLAAKLQSEQIRWQLAAVGNKKQLLDRIVFFTGQAPFQVKRTRAGITLVPLLLTMLFFMMALVMAILPNQHKITRQAPTLATLSPTKIIIPNSTPLTTRITPNNESPIALASVTPPLADTRKPRIPKKLVPPTDKRLDIDNAVNGSDVATAIGQSVVLQPVAFNEASLVREVVVEEEIPGTNIKTIKLFVLSFKNGNWVLEPKWMATSRKIAVDTALLRLDSLQIRLIDTQ